WGETGNTNDIGVGAVHWTGSYGAYFGPSGSPGYISQQLPTSTGQPYLVSLWLENPGGGTPNEYHASWGGQSLADQTNLPAFGWTNLHYTAVAGSSQNTLKLGARNDQNFFYLDEVNYWPVPLVQNGSFELGDFSDWTIGGNFENSFVSTNYLYASDGFYGAQLGPQGSLGYLSQTLPTVPGQSYLIHFELDVPQPMTNAEFNVSWNGIVLMDITNAFLHAYLPYEFVVPATSKNATLQFGFRDDSSFLGLDNVSVTAIPSPTIVSITKINSSADLSVNVMPDFLYQAQYTTNLSQPNWIPVGNLMQPTNFPMVLIDTNAADNQRFYRVLLKAPPLSF
ncbi:MAG TPA: hypothetical protein VKV04_12595, partial [Verrucomicrobiae bacterium]|nr:hypothetical protein [Verrucomicrobiae bacterium]